MTYAEVLGRLKNLFFPGGKNGDLEVAHLILSLGNYVGDIIKHELTLEDGSTTTFTIESYLGYCKTQKIRLYLITKVDPLVSIRDFSFVFIQHYLVFCTHLLDCSMFLVSRAIPEKN